MLTQTHYVEMKSDGVKIATDVMLPTIKVPKDHKFPAVFFQTRSADSASDQQIYVHPGFTKAVSYALIAF